MGTSPSFLDLYFKAVEGTEPPLMFHRWCALSGIAAMLGRKFYLPFGNGAIYPNMYCMLIGNPGTRKGTSIKLMQKVLRQVGFEKFAADRTSKEKFLLDMETHGEDVVEKYNGNSVGRKNNDNEKNPTFENLFGEEDLTPREVYVSIDEFNDFIGIGNVDFVSLLTNLWNYDGVYESRIKSGRSVRVPYPTINILGGNTNTGFAQAFPEAIIGQGFFSRILLIHGERTGNRITWPKALENDELKAMCTILQRTQRECLGAAALAPEAKEALDWIYQNWEDMEDIRFKSYSTRRFDHLMKVCLCTAAAHASKTITLDHVVEANSVLSYTESLMHKALGEFGKGKYSDAGSKILEAMESAEEPMNAQDMWKIVMNGLDKMSDLAIIISNLEQGEKIFKTSKGGWLVRRKEQKVEAKYLAIHSLPEYQATMGVGTPVSLAD